MIGFLNTYHFDLTPGCYQEKYEPMFLKYLQKIMPQETIKTYQVAQNHFPKSFDECSGWIIAGSPASAYDNEDWIKELINFTKECNENQKKLLGICFGHQLIAHALGGKIENSNKGWGVGVRQFDILQSAKWMSPELDKTCNLLFSHQDQVINLPPNAVHLGSDEFCKFQIFSIEDHVFSIQGHPEFTKEYAKERYDTRQEKLGNKVYDTAINSLNLETDELIIGKWIQNFFNT